MVYLAHDLEDGYHQTRDMAAVLNIPGNYLGKILQLMAHHKLVESQRGMNGGFRLARLPEQVRLYDVLKALDTLPTDPACPLTTGGRQMELCGLHRRFAAITRQYLDFLRGTTLQDLLVDHTIPASCPGHIPATDPLPCPEHAGRQLVVLT